MSWHGIINQLFQFSIVQNNQYIEKIEAVLLFNNDAVKYCKLVTAFNLIMFISLQQYDQ